METWGSPNAVMFNFLGKWIQCFRFAAQSPHGGGSTAVCRLLLTLGSGQSQTQAYLNALESCPASREEQSLF